VRVLQQLIARNVASRLIGSYSGWVWVVLNPLLLLAVYAFVFGLIFRARVPAGLDMPFIAWLAVALWPWLMFSEGVLRGAQAIREHAALISKVALRRELLVVSSVSAVFLLHLAGYLGVLLVLQLTATPIGWLALGNLLFHLATLYVFAVGLALALAALQVFVRDLEQAVPTLFMFWFFLTPILYAPDFLPGDMGRWLQLNPVSWWMEGIRSALLHDQRLPGLEALSLTGFAALSGWLGLALFRRLCPHFEDFL